MPHAVEDTELICIVTVFVHQEVSGWLNPFGVSIEPWLIGFTPWIPTLRPHAHKMAPTSPPPGTTEHLQFILMFGACSGANFAEVWDPGKGTELVFAFAKIVFG